MDKGRDGGRNKGGGEGEGDKRFGSLRLSRPCRRGGCAVGRGERNFLT